MKIIVGIDPGSSGGICWNEPGHGLRAVAMPGSEAEVVAIINQIMGARIQKMEGDIFSIGEMPHVFIEHVTGYVKPAKDDEERVNRQPGHTMFTFGRGVGIIMGACLAMGITPVEVHPNVWQKKYFLPKGNKTARKRALKNAAQRRHANIKVTLKTCDALLIRDYGVQTLGIKESEPEAALCVMQPVNSGEPGQRHALFGNCTDCATPFFALKDRQYLSRKGAVVPLCRECAEKATGRQLSH